MHCKLEKYIDHSKYRRQFRETLYHCLLLKRENLGMTTTDVICGGCCIKISQLIDFKKDLIIQKIVSVDDYRRNPDIIEKHLPKHLLDYYQTLKKLKITLKEAESECGRCKPEPIEDKVTHFNKAIEMTTCTKNDWR